MRIQKFTLLAFAIVVLTSCTHYYYAPNMHNVPMLKEKKDARIMIAASNGGEISSTEVQGAYAVSKNIGIQGNLMFATSKTDQDSANKGKGNLYELGIGYYKPLLASKFVFETYAGVGGAKISNTFSNKLTIHTNATRFYLQPSFGFSGRHLQVALSAKICGVNLSKPSGYGGLDSVNTAHLDYIANNPFSLMLEPALTIRLGYENIKLQLQYGISQNLSHPTYTEKEHPIQGTSNLSLGIYFELNRNFWDRMAGK